MTEIALSAASPSPVRRFLQRVTALVLGAALPTYFFTWLLGINSIKRPVNGLIWCSDADVVKLAVEMRRVDRRTAIDDTLICQKGGSVIRQIGDFRMMATNIVIALGISVALLCLLAAILMAFGRIRRSIRAHR